MSEIQRRINTWAQSPEPKKNVYAQKTSDDSNEKKNCFQFITIYLIFNIQIKRPFNITLYVFYLEVHASYFTEHVCITLFTHPVNLRDTLDYKQIN
jgi:hypothetical protein